MTAMRDERGVLGFDFVSAATGETIHQARVVANELHPIADFGPLAPLFHKLRQVDPGVTRRWLDDALCYAMDVLNGWGRT